MIPLLLWRCPLCAANDALAHTTRWPLRDRVDCANCHARWLARRVAGENFYLKLTTVNPPVERSITDWYAQMKKTLRLARIHDPQADLSPEETLYLASHSAERWSEAGSPAGVKHPEGFGSPASRGRLFLTDRRLLWAGDQKQSFPLSSIFGVYTILTLGIAVNCGRELFFFRLANESPLKWVTYFSLVAGGRVRTSHF